MVNQGWVQSYLRKMKVPRKPRWHLKNVVKMQSKDIIIISHLVPYKNNGSWEGRICLFDSQNHSVENIAKFNQYYWIYEVATTQNKVNSYVRCFE